MNVIKALPPLVIAEDDVRRFAAALEDVIARAEHLPSAMARFGLAVARRSVRRGSTRDGGARVGARA
jgi:hypothetical protein